MVELYIEQCASLLFAVIAQVRACIARRRRVLRGMADRHPLHGLRFRFAAAS